jgi:hypothetical protein
MAEEMEMQSGQAEPDLPEVVLVQVRTGMWQGTAPLKHEDIDKDEDDLPKKLFKLGQKRLYPEDVKARFTNIAQRANGILNKNGVSFILKNTYVVPRMKLPKIWQELDELKTDYNKEADEFVVEFEQIKADWLRENWSHRAKLEAHYPDKDRLRKMFTFKAVIFEIRGISVKEGDEEALLETIEDAKKNFEGLCAEMVGEAIEVLRAKVATTIENLTDRIRSGKIVRNDTLQSVKNIHEQFKELNIFGDTDIERSLDRLRGLLDNVQDAAFLKDNKTLQEQILTLADAVSSQAKDLSDVKGMTGRYKRMIDLD